MKIRAATGDDAGAIARIYEPYVSGSTISFELEPPDAAEMLRRITAGGDLYPWLAATDDEDDLIGYAYACAFRARPAYRFSVETSVYLSRPAQRQGTGQALYRTLMALLDAQGFTQAIAAIALPNQASAAFHERFGFEYAGMYRRVGFKFGAWHDVGLWQKALAAPAEPPTEPKPWSEVSPSFPQPIVGGGA